MHELEITPSRLLKIFWLFTWRAMIGGFLIGFVFGFIIGVAGRIAGFQSNLIAGAGGVLLGLIWSIFVMKMALRKNYSDFRIALVSLPALNPIRSF
jgi:hypothetical protein